MLVMIAVVVVTAALLLTHVEHSTAVSATDESATACVAPGRPGPHLSFLGAVPATPHATAAGTAQVPVYSASLAKQSMRQIGGDSLVFDRTSSLSRARSFSFVHISKCGGASFISWARSLHNIRADRSPTFRIFSPRQAQGDEAGNLHELKRFPTAKRLALLRSPRTHLMSLFRECRYNAWGRQETSMRTHAGKSTIPHMGTHLGDFQLWLDYFVLGNDTSGLGCYNPWNYQARALQSSALRPHTVGEDCDFEPSVDGSVAEALRLDWVGLQDFYHESLCLLVFRIDGVHHPYMQNCACDALGAAVPNTDMHITHNVSRNSAHIASSHLSLDVPTAAKADRLTAVDRTLFGVVLRGFIAEIVELESRIGRQVLCNATLQNSRAALAYVDDVVVLYELLKAQHLHA